MELIIQLHGDSSIKLLVICNSSSFSPGAKVLNDIGQKVVTTSGREPKDPSYSSRVKDLLETTDAYTTEHR